MVLGLRVEGQLRVEGLGLTVSGLGFLGLGFKVQGFGEGGQGGGKGAACCAGLQLPLYSWRTVRFQIVVAHGGEPFPGKKRGRQLALGLPSQPIHLRPEASADYEPLVRFSHPHFSTLLML